MRFLLLIQNVFEPPDLLLHVRINLQVPRDNNFHFVDVLVDVAVFLTAGILQRRNQLTLLSQQLSCLLQVLKVLGSQDVLLLHHVIHLFVEGQQVAVELLATVQRLSQVVHFQFPLLGRLLNVFVNFLFFLLHPHAGTRL